jgi:hypothetical protein
MRYMLLMYRDEKWWDAKPEQERAAIRQLAVDAAEDLRKRGIFLAGDPLLPTHTATTVRLRSGKAVTTDGPFAETKEQLGGYYFIEARDLNDAIQVASRIPSARLGSVEVRPVVDFAQMEQPHQKGATAKA